VILSTFRPSILTLFNSSYNRKASIIGYTPLPPLPVPGLLQWALCSALIFSLLKRTTNNFISQDGTNCVSAGYHWHGPKWCPLTNPAPTHYFTVWSSTCISLLWAFTKNLWRYRNHIARGFNEEEAYSKKCTALHDQIKTHYKNFQANPAYILPRHHQSLSTTSTLEHRLNSSLDYMTCWLSSVEEACNILEFQISHL
jgi:hypothetical protein